MGVGGWELGHSFGMSGMGGGGRGGCERRGGDEKGTGRKKGIF